MARRVYFRDPPKNQPMVDAKGRVTLSWSTHLDALARPGNATDVDVTYDPISIPSGGFIKVAVPSQGAQPGDFVVASFDPLPNEIELTQKITVANVVVVKFENDSAGAVDLPAGVLRVRFWRHDP